MRGTVIVVGGGQAACQFVASVRQMGYGGRLMLIGEEPSLPYQRPPLSKGYLAGTADAPSLHLRPASFYAEANCELLLGQSVERINREEATVTLRDGSVIAYDSLVLATGARARLLPGASGASDRVCYLRDLVQADGLKVLLPSVRRLAIVGAGYVGMEVAASARKMGIEVTVLETAPRVMQRSVGEEISKAVQQFHGANGVDVKLGCEISNIGAWNNGIDIVTSQGQISADLLVVGIGAVANVEVASAAGLACQRGILVNERAQTSDPSIYAIGDCSEQVHPLYGAGLRLESVANAIDQAKIAASGIAGKPLPAVAVPWFWSDQYEHRLQVAGLPLGCDQSVVRKADDQSDSAMSVWHLRQGRVMAVEALNAPADFMLGRNHIRSGSVLDAVELADAATPLPSAKSPPARQPMSQQ